MALGNNNCLDQAFYRFLNCTQFRVNVYWRSPTVLVYYNCLNPAQFLDVNTYDSHMWVFMDADNGNRLFADGSFVFYSHSWKKELYLAYKSSNKVNIEAKPLRRIVKITRALYNLTHLAMAAVRDTNISLEDVNDLEIPKTLQRDLWEMVNIKICMKTHNKQCDCLTRVISNRNS